MYIIKPNYLNPKMNAITTSLNIDQFGRDLSLRKSAVQIEAEKYINEIRAKLKVMSWAEYTMELEEEEERQQEEEKRQQEEEKRKKKEKERALTLAADQKRKALLAQGKYDLEEGEILE